MVRTALYEAAHILLTRAVRFSSLKRWALEVARRRGMRRAKVALARKLAVILLPFDPKPSISGPCQERDCRRKSHRRRNLLCRCYAAPLFAGLCMYPMIFQFHRLSNRTLQIKEGWRMFPPVPFGLARVAPAKGLTLGDHYFAPGVRTLKGLCMWDHL